MNGEELIARAREELFRSLPEEWAPEQRALVEAAFVLAEEAHRPQRRKDGEPYILHPIAVALVLLQEMRQRDAALICAALLHDVVEDTPHSIEEITQRFGEDVAFLVSSVTKRNDDQTDNYQHLMSAVSRDVRVLILKLSDRLHNMRTLSSMKPEKQWKIASETQFFFAPLAGRMGLFKVKSELENLAFRFLNRDEYDFVSWMLEEDRQRTLYAVETFMEEARKTVAEVFGDAVHWDIRYRKPYSIWREMNEGNCDFYHVPFKHYIRAAFDPREARKAYGREISEQDVVLKIYSLLAARYNEQTGSFVNYMAQPKANGYQSVHFRLLNPYGRIEEFHISSDPMRVQSYFGCLVEEGREKWLSRTTAALKELSEDPESIIPGITHSLYNEDIVVFTPKGRPVTLPKNATALDFAYEVHTDIGNHAKYARLNGKLVSVSEVLHRGDCVEIGVDDQIHPREEWLHNTVSYKARKNISQFLRNMPKPQYDRCPICHPMPGEEIIGFRNVAGQITIHTRNCQQAVQSASEQGRNIVAVSDFQANDAVLYPVGVRIQGVDRYHILRDFIHCLVEDHKLSITRLVTSTENELFTCDIDFKVHSATELNDIVVAIDKLEGVEEVRKIRL